MQVGKGEARQGVSLLGGLIGWEQMVEHGGGVGAAKERRKQGEEEQGGPDEDEAQGSLEEAGCKASHKSDGSVHGGECSLSERKGKCGDEWESDLAFGWRGMVVRSCFGHRSSCARRVGRSCRAVG